MTGLALAALGAPAAMLAMALLAGIGPGLRPYATMRAARIATLAVLAAAGALLAAVLVAGPATSPLLGVAGIGLSVRLDPVSGSLLVLVSFVGAIVAGFSRNYLDGDPRQGSFFARLCLTLAAVLTLVIAGNLVQLLLAWIGTSLSLHRLLVFYPDRQKAVIAGRKKFVTARLGDLCLAGAALQLYFAFGTTDIAAILAAARTLDSLPPGAALAPWLLVFAALLKSAQFPTHGWLPQVMETPTPVSALLHAGIINAGGFIIVRFADVMVLSTLSLRVLAIVGGFTALFGAAVMLTQTSVKVALAWSTVSQMGFLLLQCGLGLFPLAVLHMVAHSLYKAHAFLSSGSIIEIARSSWVPDKKAPGAVAILAGILAATALYAGAACLAGLVDPASREGWALGAIFVAALVLLVAPAAAGKPSLYVVGRTLLAAAMVTAFYFVLHATAGGLFRSVLPQPEVDLSATIVMALAVGTFALVVWLQLVEPSRASSPFWRRARVHLANGLYADAVFDRLVGALIRPRNAGRMPS